MIGSAWVVHDPFADRQPEYTFPPGLSMISVPMTPNTTDAKSALGIAGELRLARWQRTGEGSGYVRYGEGSGFETFAPGHGYWLELDPEAYPTGHRASLDGAIADTAKAVEIMLQPGWNQVGNPFPTSVDWQRVTVRLPEGGPVPWSTAVQSGWLRPSLWGWDGAGYRLAGTLAPWRSYWIKATREADPDRPLAGNRRRRSVLGSQTRPASCLWQPPRGSLLRSRHSLCTWRGERRREDGRSGSA